jgi:hypothetical protein
MLTHSGMREKDLGPAPTPGEIPVMSSMPANGEIRAFRVEVPDEAIAGLRRRIAATCWPSRELVDDRSQGVQLATIQERARYWAAEYDWRACEARLNALPQITTEIDGVDILFIHVKSGHTGALRPPGCTWPRPGCPMRASCRRWTARPGGSIRSR